MKFRTTFLLIIFSFSLLLIWDSWSTHSTIDKQGSSSKSLQVNDKKNELEGNDNTGNLDSDLPQLKELNVIKPTPIDDLVDKHKKQVL